MDSPYEISDEADLESVVAENDAVIVDFYADWCGPCITMATFLEEIAEDTDATIATIDTENQQRLTQEFDVSTLPTLLFFRDGELVHRHAGLPGRPEFRDLVAEHT